MRGKPSLLDIVLAVPAVWLGVKVPQWIALEFGSPYSAPVIFIGLVFYFLIFQKKLEIDKRTASQ